jgi:hypothetical protein
MIQKRNQNLGGEATYHLRVSTDWVEANFLKEHRLFFIVNHVLVLLFFQVKPYTVYFWKVNNF